HSDVIAKFKPDFLKGAMANGVGKDKAEEIFELILKFGGYGFNKSHSTRYAIIAYQTAYMKVYHPVEYMAALLTFEMGSTDKVVEYIEECKRLTLLDGTHGLKVLPPDINVSDVDFTPIYEQTSSPPPVPRGRARVVATGNSQLATGNSRGVIRFGLAAVKGVGEKAVESIIAARQSAPFRSIYEFCERVDLRAVNRSTLEALIKCGAFDSTNARRAQLLAVLEKAIEMGSQMQQDRRMGQLNMFGGSAATTTARLPETLPTLDEFSQADLLKSEKEVLGFYITSHPLTEHQSALDRYGSHTTRQLTHVSEGTEVTLGGLVAAIKKRITKNGRSAGQQMAIVTLEDLEGQMECMVFAETLADIQSRGDLLAPESIVFIKGKIDKRRESPSIIVNDVLPLSEAVTKMTTAVVLKMDREKHSPKMLSELKPVLKSHRGNIRLYAQISVDSGLATLALPSEWSVKPSEELVADIDRLLGAGTLQLIGAGTKRRLQQQKLFKDAPLQSSADEDTSTAIESELMMANDD
ncbi:MAG TPA: OB-fold nucleic acid binding domain-containing protein, partial [Tepidisphaeraceae bacterium]|nr:OB-fold nucleic acid binding domain-containing protein [Tepidisphaeraceae bacterium]